MLSTFSEPFLLLLDTVVPSGQGSYGEKLAPDGHAIRLSRGHLPLQGCCLLENYGMPFPFRKMPCSISILQSRGYCYIAWLHPLLPTQSWKLSVRALRICSLMQLQSPVDRGGLLNKCQSMMELCPDFDITVTGRAMWLQVGACTSPMYVKVSLMF